MTQFFDQFDDLTRNHPCPLDAGTMRQMNTILSRLGGTNVAGRANLRFVWGADREATKMLAQGKWVGRYLVDYKREMHYLPYGGVGLEVPLLDKTEILLPRFIIEQLDYPRVTREEWEAGRYRTLGAETVDIQGPYPGRFDIRSKGMTEAEWEDRRYRTFGGHLVDWRGPYPGDGYYRSWHICAAHTARCCNGAEIVDNKVCYGFFKLPGDYEMELVAAAIQERETRRRVRNLDDPYAHVELMEDARLIRERRLAYWQNIRSGFEEAYSDFQAAHAWRTMTDDPTKLSFGKFHFLSGHNRAGTPKKESHAIIQ